MPHAPLFAGQSRYHHSGEKRVRIKKRKGNPGRRKAGRKGPEDQTYLLTQAIENSSEIIGVADSAGRLVFVNRAFLQDMGRRREEVIGNHFGMVVAKENPPTLVQEIAEKSLRDEGWKGECLSVRADGTTFPTSLSVGPIKDHRGRVVGSFGVAQNITERKRAENALRESEERFRQLAENIREIFFVSSPDEERFLYVSPAYAEMWGRPCAELYERPRAWMDAVHPDDKERALHAIAQRKTDPRTTAEYRIIRPDGSIRWICSRTYPVYNSKGEFYRLAGLIEDITQRKLEEEQLREAHKRLSIALRESELHTSETVKLNEFVDILQSCQTVEEAYKVAGDALKAIMSSRSGALCITSPSRNVVEAVATWGSEVATEKTFSPDTCWALRRGRVHAVSDPSSPIRCGHVTGACGGGYVCVPLAAQGETLGVLHLCATPRPDSSEISAAEQMDTLCRRGKAVGERIPLALANLRLRDVLRTQSIRDPLTGLFNRRYMEESLERELRRAIRNHQSVALAMLDIDHFKLFNDTFGHQAGDTLLRALGDFLSQRTRGQDVACRFGGEEFALILSGATSEDAVARAELLREELKHLSVQHAGQTLGRISFSIGISAFPGHGTTAEELLRAADEALYCAKEDGRDRVVLASAQGSVKAR